MALDLSKLNFFNRLDARSRVFVLFGAVIGVIFLIYLGTRYFSGDSKAIGPSQVASAPKSLQSVPGGQLTAEYSKALQQANVQVASQAQMTGGSAVPTLMNYGGQPSGPAPVGNCVICSDQSANVKTNLDEWVKQGKLAPEISTGLQAEAGKNVSTGEFAADLDRLVKEGKLTPEQARLLLEQYKKQHANKLLDDSGKVVDGLIKSGNLPLAVANLLMDAQKRKVSPSEYAAMLQELVRQGKISPETAAQLLAQYTQQHTKGIIEQSIDSLHALARSGQLIPEIETELVGLENRMVPVDMYAVTLQKYVTAGKLIPAVAAQILDEFKAQKASIGPSGSIDLLLQKAEAAAYGEITDLMKEGKMSAEVGGQLTALIKKNVPFDSYVSYVNQLVQQGKLTSEISKLKIADYKLVKALRDMQQKLNNLQANNASNADYTDELKRAVEAGAITPEQAAQILQEYQASTSRGVATVASTGPTTDAFAQLQQNAAAAASTTATEPVAQSAEFSAAQTEAALQNEKDTEARVEALSAAMSGQAAQLVTAWQPIAMAHKEGQPEDKTAAKAGENGADAAGAPGSKDAASSAANAIATIKAGTIIFAVLDTTANSDYPDSPVMATIVDGQYKGAKLMGKLVTTKGVSGQMDRIALNFTLMNVESWPKSRAVTAYAIDPDTARTVLASNVDYHYLQRFGAIMATSFMQGYAGAITNAGTSTTGIFGTSTTHPELSPSSKILTALGQMGQTVGAATANYINIPPTVKVDAGVGLGILFMSDVT